MNSNKAVRPKGATAGRGDARRRLCAAAALAVAVCAGLAPVNAAAHESEQYSLPQGREFADLGPYFSSVFAAAVRDAAAEANAAIAEALADGPPELLAQRQSPGELAHRVWAQLFLAFPTNEILDARLVSQAFREQYPGLVTLYWPVPSIYDDPLLVLDLSKFVRTFFRAGNVSAGGQVFGTDKVIHFVNVGRIYHVEYTSRLAAGLAPEAATAAAVAAVSANPMLSEDGVLGLLSTGIRSNGDLAADMAGLKFYRNLSEPVQLGSVLLPPLLVRDGPYWRENGPWGPDLFTRHVSAHWNEVLNPNRYLAYVAWRLRTVLPERCADALDAYRDRHGRRMDRAGFEAIERELSTYFGEDYGHEVQADAPVSVAALCFAADAPPPADDAAAPVRPALWWAARDGRADEVGLLPRQRAAIDEVDLDGETALHAAARGGHVRIAQQLLTLGAAPDHAALYGSTPLWLACGRGDVAMARLLLEAGASPDAAGPFGRTPLHQAVAAGRQPLAELLLRHGADAHALDDTGNSPAHLAAAYGQAALVDMLAARQAVGDQRNQLGDTAADTAARYGHAHLALHIDQLARAAKSPGWAKLSQAEAPAVLPPELQRAP